MLFLLDEIDPRVSAVVIDEGDKISTPSQTYILCWSPYIRMYQVELVLALVTLVGERKSVLLPEMAGLGSLCVGSGAASLAPST